MFGHHLGYTSVDGRGNQKDEFCNMRVLLLSKAVQFDIIDDYGFKQVESTALISS